MLDTDIANHHPRPDYKIAVPDSVPIHIKSPAGEWARYIKWAVNQRNHKSELIHALFAKPSKYEPTLRPETGRQWTPNRFWRITDDSRANLEAVLIQVVGEEATTECKHCQQENGPFHYCMKVDETSACGNCRFRGQQRRCTFYRESSGSPLRRSPRRVLLSNEEQAQKEEELSKLPQ